MLILFCIFSFSSTLCVGQQDKLEVSVEIDTTKMLIGEQIRALLLVQQEKNLEVNRPVFLDTLGAFEIISEGSVDTVSPEESKFINTEQEILITTFDSGFFVVPPITLTYKDDTNDIKVSSEACLIAVYTVPVDTSAAIKDIKANIELPLGWRDFLPFILVLLAIIILFLILRWVYLRFFTKKKEIKAKPKVIIPAHIIALGALEELKNKELWQKGETKSFHTKLTDIVRDYLKNRYGINAPEMTTEELMASPSAQILDATIKDDLEHILKLADLVKFAKSKPGPQENENSIDKAEEIIQKTKLVVQKAAAEGKEVESL